MTGSLYRLDPLNERIPQLPLKFLFFTFGVIAVGYVPYLPALGWVLCLLPLTLCCFIWPRIWYSLAFGVGVAWGIIAGHHLSDQQLKEEFAGRDLVISGQIKGLPERDEQRLRFDFSVHSVATTSGESIPSSQFPRKLQLSWYQPRGYAAKSLPESSLPQLVIGDHWQLSVRLKRPRGFVNPAGFDYHAWLLRQGVGATGYVVTHSDNRLLDAVNTTFSWDDWINQQRQNLQHWVMHRSNSSERGILVALLIGDAALVDKPQWQRMQQTGTSHLIAISGLHVGFLALFGFYVGLFLGKCVQLRWHRCPALIIAWVSAICCASFYAALAGFNIPTVRTLIMLSLFYAACLARRHLRISDIFCWALVWVVILDPLAAYDMGFWLSFGAVGLLLVYFSGRLVTKRSAEPWAGFSLIEMVVGFIRSQWVMFIGLILPLSLLVSTVSLVAPVANAVAIPLITFFVVPLLLIGASLGETWPGLSTMLLSGAANAMELLAVFLDTLLTLAGAWASPVVAFPSSLVLLLSLSVLVIILPRGLFPKYVGIIGAALAATLGILVKAPVNEDLKVALLDVGQGTAIVVQVGSHTLVYDAGPQYTRSFDAGSAIVAPYLYAQGIRAIDYLVVSHRDMDHAGGVKGLLEKVQVGQVLEGEPERVSVSGLTGTSASPASQSCHDYPPWRWQAVEFRFLAVPESARGSVFNNANNQSCVLLISHGDEHILLPGDIETRVEHQLLYSDQVPSDLALLAAAHHGSRSSSGLLWVQRTRPRYVVYSAGYRSQHGHPHPQVRARYDAVGSQSFSTADAGALIFRWRDLRLESVELYRDKARRYWYDL